MTRNAGRIVTALRAGRTELDRSVRWGVPLLVLIGMLGVRLSGWPWVEALQHRAFDAFLNIAPRPYVDAGVRVIDIDDESLARLGQWPWPRTLVARFVRRLRERGVQVVAFDAMFPEPDRTSPRRVLQLWSGAAGMEEVRARLSKLKDHDQLLAEELRRSPVVLGFAPTGDKRARPPRPKREAQIGFFGTLKQVGTDAGGEPIYEEQENPHDYLHSYPGATSNLPVLEDAAAGLGSIGFRPEHDGVIRRAPMLFRFDELLYPTLSAEALRVAQGGLGFKVRIGGTNKESRLERLIDSQTGLTAMRVGRQTVPLDGTGHVWVYYTRETAPRTLPAWKVMDPAQTISGLQGAIAFVGTSAAGLKDLRSTPLNPAEAGVQVHANLTEQMLLGEYLKRPGRAARIEVAVTALAGLVLLVLLARLGAVWSAPVGLGMIAGMVWVSWHAFSAWHWLLDPVFPVGTLTAVYASFAGVAYVKSETDRRRITDTFGRYLSPKVVAKLAEKPGAVQLGGETRQMTFHFCDIRGFTTISEKFDPHGLTVFINNFLTPMTQIILEHDGTIDKYMGDCIMAFWNAPMDVPDHAAKACRAALRMHARLKELNAQWQAEAAAEGRTLPLIEIGTGLNTGPCVVGNMGSTLRVDYTVLGDDVNLASRLEGQSKSYGVKIVIGPLTRESAPDFAAIELDLIKVKGKTKPVRIYALLGDEEVGRSAPFLELLRKHEAMLEAYRAQRWDEAKALLDELQELGRPWDLRKLYRLYEGRVALYRLEPPGQAWDGVFVATSK